MGRRARGSEGAPPTAPVAPLTHPVRLSALAALEPEAGLAVAQARTHPSPSRCDDIDERFYKARDAFSAARFKALYRVWKQDGDRALAELGSAALHAAVTADAGRVETLELGHRYGHLTPRSTALDSISRARKGTLSVSTEVSA